MIKYSLVFLILAVLIGCKDDEDNSLVKVDKDFISELNAKSVDTLTIETRRFVLDAYIWRDFMPISPPNGKPMISINWLRNLDSTKVPVNIDLVKQYVIYNESVWIAEYENTTYQPSEYKIEKVSRSGPKWGPKIYVDVISNVRDYDTNKDYFLRIKNVYVGRTD